MNGALTTPGKRLEGKVAIITGGASGIGAAAAKLFHVNGAKVVIGDIEDELGQALADKLGEGVCYFHCDVTNEDDVIRLVGTAVDKFGKLDIMYNNAGITDGIAAKNIIETTKSDLERLVSINTVGGFLGAKHAARAMAPRRQGCILFTARACTEVGGVRAPASMVSNYGTVAMVNSLAADLGQHGIRVNCVSPIATKIVMPMPAPAGGTTDSEIVEAQISSPTGSLKEEVPKADDVAKAALYLASDEANYVSGVKLVIDGGFGAMNPACMYDG